MKKLMKRMIILLLCALFIFAAIPANAKYVPPTETVKIGLDYGSSTLAAAYLEAVSGYGSGFRFGYYDSNRNFVTIGSTSYTAVAVLKDVNMYESGGRYYTTVHSGSKATVGCYHIQLDRDYGSYSAARSAADTFTSVNAFVKYDHGGYYVCAGAYTSSSAASAAAETLNIRSSYSITSGTTYTVTLIHTSTGKILFEFDYGTTRYLGVQPYTNNGTKAQTWHAGYRYYGGFQFARLSGGDITCVNYVNVEDYIKGVIPYEMNASWPREALKAQAVCARTYVMAHLNAHKSKGFDLCNTADCQVYRGTGSASANSDAAVNETAGKYMFYNGALCEGYYSSCDGGATESSENVWSNAVGYLKGVIDPYEAAIASSISNYYWSYTYTGSELASKLRSAGYSCSTIVNYYVSKYTPTGNVYSMTFVDSNGKTITISKASCRSLLGFRSQRFKIYNKASDGTLIDTSPAAGQLYVNGQGTIDANLSDYYGVGSTGTVSKFSSQTAYAISGSGDIEQVGGSNASPPKPVSGTFVISGSGWGHNVGMSQWGAYSMARYYNKTYDEILKFYFTGITIE